MARQFLRLMHFNASSLPAEHPKIHRFTDNRIKMERNMVPCLSMEYKLLLILPISCYAIFDIFKLRKMIEIIQLEEKLYKFQSLASVNS